MSVYVCTDMCMGIVVRIGSTQDQATESMAQQRLESALLCRQVARRCIKPLRRVNSIVAVSSLPPAVKNTSQTEWSFCTPTERICVLIHNHNVHYAPDDHGQNHVRLLRSSAGVKPNIAADPWQNNTDLPPSV